MGLELIHFISMNSDNTKQQDCLHIFSARSGSFIDATLNTLSFYSRLNECFRARIKIPILAVICPNDFFHSVIPIQRYYLGDSHLYLFQNVKVSISMLL